MSKINLNKNQGILYVATVARYATRRIFIENRYRVIYCNNKQVLAKKHRGNTELFSFSNSYHFANNITYDFFKKNYERYKTSLVNDDSLSFKRVLVPKKDYDEFKKLIRSINVMNEDVEIISDLKLSARDIERYQRLVRHDNHCMEQLQDKIKQDKENLESCEKRYLQYKARLINFYTNKETNEINIPEDVKEDIKRLEARFDN